MIISYKTSEHPEANGRLPLPGEKAWCLSFPLENGADYLEIHIGKKGRDAIASMLIQEEEDDREADRGGGK